MAKMSNNTITEFIVIDDDHINNYLCDRIVRQASLGATVRTFTNPEEGLEHLLSAYGNIGSNDAILFLDINMPQLDGWDVLDRINELPFLVKQHIQIHMLSSSIDERDVQKANDHPLVSSMIYKPLSIEKVQAILPRVPEPFAE